MMVRIVLYSFQFDSQNGLLLASNLAVDIILTKIVFLQTNMAGLKIVLDISFIQQSTEDCILNLSSVNKTKTTSEASNDFLQ